MEKNIPTVQDKYRKGKFFNLAEELKSFIALNIFGFNIIEFYLLEISSLFNFFERHWFFNHDQQFIWYSTSKVIHEVCHTVVKHLAFKSVWSVDLQFWVALLSQNFYIFDIVFSVKLFIVLACLRWNTCL